jgi:hypothetical protein
MNQFIFRDPQRQARENRPLHQAPSMLARYSTICQYVFVVNIYDLSNSPPARIIDLQRNFMNGRYVIAHPLVGFSCWRNSRCSSGKAEAYYAIYKQTLKAFGGRSLSYDENRLYRWHASPASETWWAI